MPLYPNMETREFLKIFLRGKWYILFSFLFVLFGASVYCVVVPEQYKSSTSILVVPQRVPEGYVRSTVSIRIEERLSTIRQQVLSRTRLTTVMEELGLFKEERKKKPLEEVVEEMRKRIEIQVRSGERSGDRVMDAFSLSFIHENRQMAMLTASRLASFFIDENLKSREQQAVSTSEFLENQLQDTKKKLEEQEEKVKRYKMSFMGELPQQMQANMQVLSRLQEQLKSNNDATRTAEDRRLFLEAQATSIEVQLNVLEKPANPERKDNVPGAGFTFLDPAASLVAELNAKKARLSELNARYTDRYPEIVRLKSEVAGLEKRVAEVRASPQAGPAAVRTSTGAASTAMSPYQKERDEIRRIRNQASSLGIEVASLKKERGDTQKHIAVVEARVERSPKREQEMISLTRDYENLKRSYDDLLKKKLEADISQNLEKRQKGEQFQILDPANLPEEPFKPDRKKVLGIAFLAAMILGFGGVIGYEALDPTLRGAKEFKHFFELPVLASIPALQDRIYTRRQKIRQGVIVGGIVSFSVALSVFLFSYGDKIRSILKISWSG
jgi:polysaccharide chain length determinant protein (PEP-CTERM system associated)